MCNIVEQLLGQAATKNSREYLSIVEIYNFSWVMNGRIANCWDRLQSTEGYNIIIYYQHVAIIFSVRIMPFNTKAETFF